MNDRASHGAGVDAGGGTGETIATVNNLVEFLLKTQFEDGSWCVRTRALVRQPIFPGGLPHQGDEWISAAATNWAAMALAGTVTPPNGKYNTKMR